MALFAGLLWGCCTLSREQLYPNAGSALIEYPIAFTAGFAGLYHEPLMQAMHDRKMRHQISVIKGTLAGAGARFFWHLLLDGYSGVPCFIE